MRLNTLRSAPGSTHAKRRVGRGIGSGLGKTCGRGHKGQKSRSGGQIRPGFEGGQMPLQKRVPKFGFHSRIGLVTAEVRTSELNKVDAKIINLEALEKANIIHRNIKRAKVMLSGEVTKAVTLQGLRVTKGAQAAIEAVGGKVLEAKPGATKTKAKPSATKTKTKPSATKTKAKTSATKTKAKTKTDKTAD